MLPRIYLCLLMKKEQYLEMEKNIHLNYIKMKNL